MAGKWDLWTWVRPLRPGAWVCFLGVLEKKMADLRFPVLLNALGDRGLGIGRGSVVPVWDRGFGLCRLGGCGGGGNMGCSEMEAAVPWRGALGRPLGPSDPGLVGAALFFFLSHEFTTKKSIRGNLTENRVPATWNWQFRAFSGWCHCDCPLAGLPALGRPAAHSAGTVMVSPWRCPHARRAWLVCRFSGRSRLVPFSASCA